MRSRFHRDARQVLGVCALLLLASAAPAPAIDRAIVPFTYWYGPTITVDSWNPAHGWQVPTQQAWKELFPGLGATHSQLRYIDNDANGLVSHGDEILAVGEGPGVWRVEWVTTYLLFEPGADHPELPRLEVASDDFYQACTYICWESLTCPPHRKPWPDIGDTMFVLTPNFGENRLVCEYFPTWQFCPYMRTGDAAGFSAPGQPCTNDTRMLTHSLQAMGCGVWLSWDTSTDAATSTWGRVKNIYRR